MSDGIPGDGGPEKTAEIGDRVDPVVSRDIEDLRFIMRVNGFVGIEDDDALFIAIGEALARLRRLEYAVSMLAHTAAREGLASD